MNFSVRAHDEPARQKILIDESQRAAWLQKGGRLGQEAEELLVLLRPIDDRYVLAVALKPDGNLGMARYQLAAKAPDLRRALAG